MAMRMSPRFLVVVDEGWRANLDSITRVRHVSGYGKWRLMPSSFAKTDGACIATVMKDEQGRPFIVVREYVKGPREVSLSEAPRFLDVQRGTHG